MLKKNKAYPVFDLLGKDLDYFKNWKNISDDPEDFSLCIAREKWFEMEYALKSNSAYFWDGKNILDSNMEIDDYIMLEDDKIFFPRTCVPKGSQKGLWDILERIPNSIMNKRDYITCRAWLHFMPF